MSILQIIVGGLALYFIGTTIRGFVCGSTPYAPIKFLSNFIVWGGAFFLAIFPDSARTVSGYLSIGENLNTLIFLGFVSVFMFMFKLLKFIERVESNITDLVRSKSLSESIYDRKAHKR